MVLKLGDLGVIHLIGKAKPGQIDLTAAIRGIQIAHPNSVQQTRISACRGSFSKFLRTYLRPHFPKKFCELHWDIIKEVERSLPPEVTKGKRVARIAPRKMGKTTLISLGLPLWKLAYQEKFFIILVGEAGGTAEGNLSSITKELENNDLLLRDFPHLAPAKDNKGQFTKWTDRQIVLKSGATVVAKGLGARMRGIKHGHQRPDLAILDDPESPETADTFLKRQRHKRWFGGTFMGLGDDRWDVYVIGNLPHRDCLIASLVKSKEWSGKLWRAINIRRREEIFPIGNTKQDGSPLWPESWSLKKLNEYKNEPEVGALQFAREMMNDPRVEEDKPFDPTTFAYFDWTPERLMGYVTIVTAIDPAGGHKEGEFKKGKRDWCAIVTGGRCADGWIEIFDVQLTKKTPDIQVDRALDVYQQFPQTEIRVEENMFKNLLASTMTEAARRRGLYPTVTVIQQTGNKNKTTRILGTQPMIADSATRVVRFARHLILKVPTYFAMFDEFPGDYDDGPDATEILIKSFEALTVYGEVGGPTAPSNWAAPR